MRSLEAVALSRGPILRELGVLGGLLAAFTALLILVARSAPTGFDRRWAAEIQAIPWGEFAFVPRLGSDLGGGVSGLLVVPALVVAGFVGWRRWRLLALFGAVFVLHFVMISPKLFVTAHRPSPSFGVEGAGGLGSFPSGHVQWSASFLGFLAYLTWKAAPARLRPPIVALYASAVLATMLGRIELGRHWPIDTVGGVIAGLIALRLVVLLDRWLGRGAAKEATQHRTLVAND